MCIINEGEAVCQERDKHSILHQMTLFKELLSGQQKGLKQLVTAPQNNLYIRDTTPHMYVHMYYHTLWYYSTGMGLDEYSLESE